MEKKYFGVMLDMSRNAVMKPEELKKFARIIRSFGYNMIELYTEDTYEVEGEPYFGYMRGRYTKAELKAINIKDNTHAGEWDLDMLADWTAELNIDLGIEEPKKPIEERSIRDMEPIHYEKYDYVIIACRNQLDYNDLVRKLGIEGGKVKVTKTRRIKCRAIWYDKMKARIVPY